MRTAGAIIQDMGLLPSRKLFFSDLTHYYGAETLFCSSPRFQGSCRLCFCAWGPRSLRLGQRRSPHRHESRGPAPVSQVKTKYGDSVTYEEDKLAHVKTEFGFDILESSTRTLCSGCLPRFIGFGVSAPLLEQAFQETYGLDLKTVLTNEEPALVPTVTLSVSSFPNHAHCLEPEERRDPEGSAQA